MLVAGSKYFIPVWEGLLDPNHIRKMGEAVWAYLWFLDKQEISEEELAPVCFGNPIAYDEIADDLGKSVSTIRRWVSVLVTNDYVSRVRTPRGFVYYVTKGKKRVQRGRASQGQSECSDMNSHYEGSAAQVIHNDPESECPDMSSHPVVSVHIRHRECSYPAPRVSRCGHSNIDNKTLNKTLNKTTAFFYSTAVLVDNFFKDTAQTQDLLTQVLEAIGENERSDFYPNLRATVTRYPSAAIYQALSRLKDDETYTEIHRRGAYFFWLLRQECPEERGN